MNKALVIIRNLIINNIHEYRKYKALTLRNNVYKELINILSNGSYKEIEDNSRDIILLLQQLYENDKAIEYNDIIRNSLKLVNLTNDNKYLEPFDNLKTKLLEDQKNNLEELVKINYDELLNRDKLYSRIYYFIKFKSNLTDDMVNTLKEMLNGKLSENEINNLITECQSVNKGEQDKTEILNLLNYKLEDIEKVKPTNLTDYNLTTMIYDVILKDLDDVDYYTIINNIKENELLIKRYIISNVLDNFELQIKGIELLLKDDDFYFDKDTRDEIIIEFNKLMDNYKELTDYMKSLLKSKPYIHQNQIWYESSNGTNITYFEEDLKELNNQKYIDITGDLLIDFQNDELEGKIIDSEKYDDNLEIKDENISIIMKHVSDNCYVVKGVIDNTNINNYDLVCERRVHVNFGSIIDRSNKVRLQDRIDKYKIEKEYNKMEAK